MTDYLSLAARVGIGALQPGVLRAINDPFTGLLAGVRAPLLAEIINRALRSRHTMEGSGNE